MLRQFVNQSHGLPSFLYICSHRENVAQILLTPLLDTYAVDRPACATHGQNASSPQFTYAVQQPSAHETRDDLAFLLLPLPADAYAFPQPTCRGADDWRESDRKHHSTTHPHRYHPLSSGG